MKDSTDKNKTPLSITTLNTNLINSLLIISPLIKYFLCLCFSVPIKSFFPFSLQFLPSSYFLSFFLPEYHFPYTCFTKCSSKNIHGRSCKWHQTTKWGDLIGMYYLNCIFFYAYFHDTDVRSLFYCTYWITGYFHRGPGWIHFKGLAW